jgi:DNA-binding SARP family transcriptional activator
VIEFGVLGPLVVRSEGGEIKIAGARRRALLIRLLVSANRSVPTARLAEDVWEGQPPAGAVSTLASHISLLRQLLDGDRIQGGAGGYTLTVGEDELDVSWFEREVSQGRAALARGTANEAVELLVRALGRWRGPALDDVGGAEWARPDSVRLEELRLGAEEVLLDARLALGQNEEVVAAAEAAVAQCPLREQFWGHLMKALYRSGRQAEALRAYQRLRTALGEELGLEPSEKLTQLERAIVLREPELNEGSSQVRVRRGERAGS